MEHIAFTIPGKVGVIRGLKLTCPVCLVTHELEGVGYKLPQTEQEIKANCARYVLIKTRSDTPLCDCLLERLNHFPVVALWEDISQAN